MTLQVATLYEIGADSSLVGVFSTPAKAIAAGENAIRELTESDPILLDWDHEHPEHHYFFDGFTLTITETTLDQAV